MQTGRAARFYGSQDLRIEAVPLLPLVEDEYRVRVAYAGICGSDVHEYYHGPWNCSSEPGGPLLSQGVPQILGHEFAGTIVEGPSAGDLPIGTKVAIEPVYGCGQCQKCMQGQPALCKKGLAMYGYSRAGGLADFVVVKRANLHRLPPTLPLWIGALAEPFSVAWHAAGQGRICHGSSVFIAGCGPIGLLLIRVLKARGAGQIVVSEPNKARAAAALAAGASEIHDSSDDSASLNNIFDVAFDCAGLAITADMCLQNVRRGGTMVMVALWLDKAPFDMLTLVLKEVQLQGSSCFASRDMDAVIDAFADGSLSAAGVVSSVISLEEVASRGLARLKSGTNDVKILVEVNAVPGEAVNQK